MCSILPSSPSSAAYFLLGIACAMEFIYSVVVDAVVIVVVGVVISILLLFSLVSGRANRVILLLSSVAVLKLFDVVCCCLSDSLNQLRRRRLSWETGMISAASFLNRAFATDCSHCCLIVVGY